MRLLTRADLDGLTCAALIRLHEDVDRIVLAQPHDIADGRLEVRATDIVANLPFDRRCALWFDHHLHSAAAPPADKFAGAFGRAPSAARLVYEYYGGRDKLPRFAELVRETDRMDSADLSLDDILDPQGYIKLGFTLDGRSGLGDLGDYFVELLDLVTSHTPVGEILLHPEVEERCRRLEDEDVRLHAALQEYSRVERNVVLTDFRPLSVVPAGNRFLVFALFPQINVAMRVQRTPNGKRTQLALGHSIVNRTCRTNLGELAAGYGGGGHPGAASIELGADGARQIESILADLRDAG